VEGETVDRRYLRMPHVERGMTVGLFGGSFNPPHEGHLLVAEIAMRRLALDNLWWMVTPGNPLKSRSELVSLSDRIAASEKLIDDPRIKVTAFEQALDTRFTADTVAHVAARNPGIRFVWIMGADSLKTFHLWQNWRQIVATFPIAIVDRPGATLSLVSSTMARAYDHARIDEEDAANLAMRPAPAWTFLHDRRSSISSTQLRAKARQKT
jgi:nicotinate-nucleotide adenylyltransferase